MSSLISAKEAAQERRIKEAAQEVHRLRAHASAHMLDLADQINAYAQTSPERCDQLIDDLGFDYQTIQNARSTARAVPAEMRRLDSLSIAHHHAIAPLRGECELIQTALLKAEVGEWSSAELRMRARAAKLKIANALHPEIPLEEITAALPAKVKAEINPIIRSWDNATIEQRNEARAYLFPHSHVEPEASPLTAPCEAPAFGAPADHAPRPDPVGGGTPLEQPEQPAYLREKLASLAQEAV